MSVWDKIINGWLVALFLFISTGAFAWYWAWSLMTDKKFQRKNDFADFVLRFLFSIGLFLVPFVVIWAFFKYAVGP